MQDIIDYIDTQRDRYIEMIQRACQQPSISTQNIGIPEMAELCRTMLTDVGASAQIIPIEGGNPVVFGQIDGPAGRILNFYNHYDVQPPEPLDLWESDPFAAEVRDGRIWARGVGDNKGHLVARICAVDAWRHIRGDLPLTIRFIQEGEEEIGSPNLERFVHEHRALITPADGCIWEGGGRDFNGRIRLSCGLKGICYVELSARGREHGHAFEPRDDRAQSALAHGLGARDAQGRGRADYHRGLQRSRPRADGGRVATPRSPAVR